MSEIFSGKRTRDGGVRYCKLTARGTPGVMQATEATRTPAEASAAATTAIIVAFFADAVAAGYSEDAMRTTFECGMDGVAAVVSTKIVSARAQNSSGTDAQIDAWIVNKYKDAVAAAVAANVPATALEIFITLHHMDGATTELPEHVARLSKKIREEWAAAPGIIDDEEEEGRAPILVETTTRASSTALVFAIARKVAELGANAESTNGDMDEELRTLLEFDGASASSCADLFEALKTAIYFDIGSVVDVLATAASVIIAGVLEPGAPSDAHALGVFTGSTIPADGATPATELSDDEAFWREMFAGSSGLPQPSLLNTVIEQRVSVYGWLRTQAVAMMAQTEGSDAQNCGTQLMGVLNTHVLVRRIIGEATASLVSFVTSSGTRELCHASFPRRRLCSRRAQDVATFALELHRAPTIDVDEAMGHLRWGLDAILHALTAARYTNISIPSPDASASGIESFSWMRPDIVALSSELAEALRSIITTIQQRAMRGAQMMYDAWPDIVAGACKTLMIHFATPSSNEILSVFKSMISFIELAAGSYGIFSLVERGYVHGSKHPGLFHVAATVMLEKLRPHAVAACQRTMTPIERGETASKMSAMMEYLSGLAVPQDHDAGLSHVARVSFITQRFELGFFSEEGALSSATITSLRIAATAEARAFHEAVTLGTIDEDKEIESHILPLLVEEATSWGEIELPRRVVLHSSDGAQFEVPPASLLSSAILKGRMMMPHHRSFIREAPIEVEDAAASAQAAAAPPTIVRLLSRGTSDDAVEGVCTALTGLRAHSSSDAATCAGAHDGYDAESETINLHCLEQAAILRKVCEFFHHLDEEPLGEIPRPLLSEDLAQCGIPGTVRFLHRAIFAR